MENRKAFHNYHINSSETLTAGLILVGSEVKALRNNHVSFEGSYVVIQGEEAFLKNLTIPNCKQSHLQLHETNRTRKLLLNKKEILDCLDWVKTQGRTLIPTKIKCVNNKFKIEIGKASGKNHSDKRHTIKLKDLKREQDRQFKR